MKLTDIIPSKDLLSLAQGVEADLVKRKRTGLISAIVTLAWAVIQILLAAQTSYFGNIGTFFTNLVAGDWGKLFGPGGIKYSEFVGLLVLAAGFGTYFLLNWTSFLLKETEEPFRYSFWIEPFTLVGGPEKNSLTLVYEGQMPLLHRDLMERLNQRIQRLSLLDRKSLEPAASNAAALKSHIHIGGDYAIREEKPGQWIIHVMARIRVGPPGKPETLAYPVRYPLKLKQVVAKNTPAGGSADGVPAAECSVDVDSYKRIVERVYSRVATEIYRQIEIDVQEKIDLFPTSYLRAVALYREAQDMARSNTIDAYDHAISLYRQALRYFNVANVRPLTNLFLCLPVLWRFQTKFVHVQAMVQVGYAQSLIYRRNISEYSGRYRNPLFEISGELTEVIRSLTRLHNKMNSKWPLLVSEDREANNVLAQNSMKGNRLNTLMALFTFPRDSWITPLSLRPSRALFHKQTQILFDCYVVAALTYHNLGSIQKAKRYLGDAEAAGPGLSETNALYLLAAGEIEPDREKAILLFRQATEIGTNFEIAQYSLAKNMETLFRKQEEFLEERSRIVMREYDEVLAINPGNIAALASQGYLLWLLGDFEGAKGKFEDGRDNKAIVRQTFIGELNYGLARAAAEEGRFSTSYDLYTQTIAADPGVGAYSLTAGRFATTQYYDDISPAMLARYSLFRETVEKKISELTGLSASGKMRDADGEEVSDRILNVVHSCVLNDYGNACLTYFRGVGDPSRLDDGIRAFEQARDKDPESKIVPYNLHTAYLWRNKEEDKIPARECLEKAERLGPTWPISVFALAQSRLRHVQENMMNTMGEAEQHAIAESKDRERQLARAGREQPPDVSPEVSHAATTSSSEGVRQSGDVKGIQSSMLEAPQRVQDRYESAQSLYEKAMKQLDELEKVLPEVQKVMRTTKLSSIYQGFNFDIKGNGVDRLLSADIGRDRLDENDVRALRLWAEVLSNNFRSELALQTAERICTYILENYYPESFDAISIPRDMYLRRKREDVLRSSLTTENSERADHDQAIAESTRKFQAYTDLLKPVVRDWAERNPTDYAVLTWVQDVFKDEPLVAIEIFERTVKLAPKNSGYWNSLGIMYHSSERYELSIERYKKAIELDPRTVVYRTNLGNAFEKLKRWNEAIAAYVDALKLDPKNAGYWNSLGIMYYSSERYELSSDNFKKAIELDPETVVYHANLGNALVNLKRWKDAEAAYVDALKLDPKNAGYWNSLGIMYYSSERYELSSDSYRKAIELDPKAAVYKNNLELALAGAAARKGP